MRQGSEHGTERDAWSEFSARTEELSRSQVSPSAQCKHPARLCEFCESWPAQRIHLQHVLPSGAVLLLPPPSLVEAWLSGVSAEDTDHESLWISGSECGRKLTFLSVILCSVKKAVLWLFYWFALVLFSKLVDSQIGGTVPSAGKYFL